MRGVSVVRSDSCCEERSTGLLFCLLISKVEGLVLFFLLVSNHKMSNKPLTGPVSVNDSLSQRLELPDYKKIQQLCAQIWVGQDVRP